MTTNRLLSLCEHVLNAASRETSRGFRLSKEKQSLKIDGAVALSFACVPALSSERPAASTPNRVTTESKTTSTRINAGSSPSI